MPTPKEKNIKSDSFELDEYQELLFAMDEEDLLMEEIEKLIENSNNKEELEKTIKEKYVPLLEKHKEKTQKAFKRWRLSISDEIKEIEDLMDKIYR